MTLLEIGCGWGLTLQRAMREIRRQRHRPDPEQEPAGLLQPAVGQDRHRAHVRRTAEGWEQFHQPVDRIVSIEAFEHFGFERYDDFFKNCFDILPDDGRMTDSEQRRLSPVRPGRARQEADVRAGPVHQVHDHRDLPGRPASDHRMMVEHGEKAGFVVPETCRCATTTSRHSESGRDRLEADKDEAIAATDEENYDRYMKYLTAASTTSSTRPSTSASSPT